MAPPLLVNFESIDLDKHVVSLDEIRKILPQRFEMEMLSGLVFVDDDTDTLVGVKELTLDDFWVRGHIPGRPLMPGVLMIECAAQLCAYQSMKKRPESGFMGFARCDDVIFRGTVLPPGKLYMIAQMQEVSRRRAVARCQGVFNGTLVFEATVTGMSV